MVIGNSLFNEVKSNRYISVIKLPKSFVWDFLFLLEIFKNSSTSSSLAKVRLSGSGSKQRSMKALASADMDLGISGCILNIPT